jgi:hypothetical protein
LRRSVTDAQIAQELAGILSDAVRQGVAALIEFGEGLAAVAIDVETEAKRWQQTCAELEEK